MSNCILSQEMRNNPDPLYSARCEKVVISFRVGEYDMVIDKIERIIKSQDLLSDRALAEIIISHLKQRGKA
jgi:hypothetical protein